MPVISAPLVGFALGVGFAWQAAPLTDTRGAATRATLVLGLFGVLLFAPATVYFLAFAPDWAFAYFVNTDRATPVVLLAATLVNALSVPAGFLLATRVGEHQASRVVRLAVPPAVIAAVLVTATLPRLAVHATYAQFHGRFGVRPVVGSDLGYALLWTAVILAVGAAWTSRILDQIAAPDGTTGSDNYYPS